MALNTQESEQLQDNIEVVRKELNRLPHIGTSLKRIGSSHVDYLLVSMDTGRQVIHYAVCYFPRSDTWTVYEDSHPNKESIMELGEPESPSGGKQYGAAIVKRFFSDESKRYQPEWRDVTSDCYVELVDSKEHPGHRYIRLLLGSHIVAVIGFSGVGIDIKRVAEIKEKGFRIEPNNVTGFSFKVYRRNE